jgi:hypothetical protein
VRTAYDAALATGPGPAGAPPWCREVRDALEAVGIDLTLTDTRACCAALGLPLADA